MATKRSSSTSTRQAKPGPQPALAPLDDLRTFAALAASARRAVAEAVAAQLGPTFRAADDLVGETALAAVVHIPSELTFVLIPGGTFEMGFTASDQAAVERYFPAAEHKKLRRALERTTPLMTPTRVVTVRPFGLATRPLSKDKELALFAGAPHAEAFARDEAEAVLLRWGLRFPSEAECEYVGREGKQLAFLLDAAAQYFEEGLDEAEDLPAREETSWGISSPGQTVWVGDRWHRSYEGAPSDASPWTQGQGRPMHRGSFSLGQSVMQSTDELIFALAALRQEPLGEDDENDVWLRLAFGPDAQGRWTITPDDTATKASTSNLSKSTATRRKQGKPAEQRTEQAIDRAPIAPPPPAPIAGPPDDALANALSEPDEGRASSLATSALIALGYPDAGQVPLLPEEMSPALHAALTTLVQTRPSLPLGSLPAPTDPAVRRRWLGLAPPGDLETMVTANVAGSERVVPYWRAAAEAKSVADEQTALTLLSPAAAVRACIEIALTGGYDFRRPEPTWPLLVEAGAENAPWAEATLARLEQHPPAWPLRPMIAYGLVYPIAAAGRPVLPTWTRWLSLVAPPASIAVWDAIPEPEREPAMIAALERTLQTTSVLNDTLFFVKRYPRPALAEACLAYFTSKEGKKKHGAATMASWVRLLQKLCAETPALAGLLARFPAK